MCCRVVIAVSTCVPANSEAIVQGKVIDALENSEFALIEPSEQFSDHYNLFVASSVINVSGDSVPVRLLNLTDQDISLNKNALVAQCVEVNEVHLETDTNEVRRCQTSESNCLPKHLER